MPRIPNFDRAVLDRRKIEEYCLSPAHPRGRHKARVFRDALGVDASDADWLHEALLDALKENEAVGIGADEYGARWRVDARLSRHGKTAVIKLIWIVRAGEDRPRFVTCWVA